MTRLNQIVAVVNGQKQRSQRALTDVYHVVQKSDLFQGLTRTYQPRDEEGEALPPERKEVQQRVSDVRAEADQALRKLWEVVSIQDQANCEAKADIVVDGRVLAGQVPVTTLMYLEKQLKDIQAFFAKLPTLDPADRWAFNTDTGLYETEPVQTVRTKKVPKSHVLYPATDKHPAQVQAYTEDVQIGTWTAVKHSGAITPREKEKMQARVADVIDAVRKAREKANEAEVTVKGQLDDVLGYVMQALNE